MLELIEAVLEENIYVKIFSVIIAVIFIIADWRIHTKAGEKGWIALIPIYNVYSFYKIVWKGSAFWYGVIIDAAIVLITAVAEWNHIDNLLINITLAVLSLLNAVYLVYTNYKASKAFGHGAGFTVGLTLLYGLFILIISFGKSKYVKREAQKA